jgi:hypothetical protein
MKRISTVVGCAVVLAVLVQAQAAFTGKWQGETRNHAPLLLDMTATETTLTGTLTLNGQPATIADGKVSKNTFTFKVTLNGRTEAFSGEYTGDQITVRIDRIGPESAAVLKRVKD